MFSNFEKALFCWKLFCLAVFENDMGLVGYRMI